MKKTRENFFILIILLVFASGCIETSIRDSHAIIIDRGTYCVSDLSERYPVGYLICTLDTIIELDFFTDGARTDLRVESARFSAGKSFMIPPGSSLLLSNCEQISDDVVFTISGKLEIRSQPGFLNATFVLLKGGSLILDDVMLRSNLTNIIVAEEADTISLKNVRIADVVGNCITGSAKHLILSSSYISAEVTKSCLLRMTLQYAEIYDCELTLDCNDEISENGIRCIDITAFQSIRMNRNHVSGYKFDSSSYITECITLVSRFIECHENSFDTLRAGKILSLYGVFTSCMANRFHKLTSDGYLLLVNSYRGAEVCGNIIRDVLLAPACAICVFGKCESVSNNKIINCSERRSSALIMLPTQCRFQDNIISNNRVTCMFFETYHNDERTREAMYANISLPTCKDNIVKFVMNEMKNDETKMEGFLDNNTINKGQHSFTLRDIDRAGEFEEMFISVALESFAWPMALIKRLKLKYEPDDPKNAIWQDWYKDWFEK